VFNIDRKKGGMTLIELAPESRWEEITKKTRRASKSRCELSTDASYRCRSPGRGHSAMLSEADRKKAADISDGPRQKERKQATQRTSTSRGSIIIATDPILWPLDRT